jgi:hypothetical protein
MAHLTKGELHGYQKRATEFTITVKGPEVLNSWSNAQVWIGDLIQKNVTLAGVVGGIRAYADLTAIDLDIPPRAYQSELVATIGGQLRTRAVFTFRLDPEPTPTP